MTSALNRDPDHSKPPRAIPLTGQWLGEFLFAPTTGLWLGLLRIGLGIQVVLYALSLAGDWNSLFAGAEHGLISRAFAELLLARQSPLAPRLGWLTTASAHLGLSEWATVSTAWWILLLAGLSLVAGVASRASAIVAWFIHLCATNSGSLVTYGVDNFMTIGLFYLMLSPLPDLLALERRWRVTQTENQHALGFWRRVLQLHLCLIYFFGGLAKALGGGWWDGTNLWRALTRAPFNLLPADTLVHWKYFFPAAGIAVVILEMGYAFFIWPARTRFVWLMCVLAMHVGIGLAMGMYLFSLVMIVLNIAAFGPEFLIRVSWSDTNFLLRKTDSSPSG